MSYDRAANWFVQAPPDEADTMSAATLDQELLAEVKSILRRDLKLGPDARIADDMPLIGGEMDLDSLDILLVISSIEKHFKIKIPNEVVGRWVFQDVRR